jgi:hypothetical protein
MNLMQRVHEKHLVLMQKTLDTLSGLLKITPVELLTSRTDGPDGWNILEVLCHLRDFDEVFHQRMVRIQTEDTPQLQPVNHEALVTERDYKHQNPQQVYAALTASRHAMLNFLKTLTDDQWQRAGVHPTYGEWTMTDAVMQVGHHDANHIEQIIRILA